MAFEEDLSRHVEQIKIRLPHVRGEEATKQALIVPLFQLLGYDVWDPREVQPEFGADFAKKKMGQVEKVDYALKLNGEPTIFVECKAVDAELDDHGGQLARYFNSYPSVRVAIITNGLRIKVFTDLQQPNVMDPTPWLDLDLRTAKVAEIDALKKFRKADFFADKIIDLAEEMVFYNVLVPYISAQLRDPGEKLVRLVAEEIPSLQAKRVDKKIVERLTPILRKAIQSAISDLVTRSFSAPVAAEEPAAAVAATVPVQAAAAGGAAVPDAKDGIVTTAEEIESYNVISKIIKDKFPEGVVQYRDARSYFTIMQKNSRKWFIRLGVEKAPFWIAFRHVKPEAVRQLCPGFDVADGGGHGDSKVSLRSHTDIVRLKSLILASYEAEASRVAETDATPDATE